MMPEILCYCNGDEYIHFIGSEKCLRENCSKPINNKNNTWLINNNELIDDSMKKQWDYRQHKNGLWSKLKKIKREVK